jgi:hypothetical protein
MLGLLWATSSAIAAVPETRPFGETQEEWTSPHGCRIVVNRPADFDESRPTRLILYLLPNGNTIEQTLGAKLEPGMDWHFDIQHIAAQTRKLRSIDKTENVVLACLEAEKKSWPAWRKARGDGNGKIIRAIVDEVSRAVPGPESSKHLALIAHSGGGSFLFGYLNGGDAIADRIDRIAWIDANYAYDDAEHHGDKLLAWLKGDPRGPKRHLVVLAYNDRKATLNGKPFVSETGGTFYRSHKMIERLSRDIQLSKSDRGSFEEHVGMNGQVHFLLHRNDEGKILHTVLVERNGLLEAMTWDSDLHDKWGGTFWGERAYVEFIAPLQRGQNVASRPATTLSAKRQATSIPARPANAMGGKMFCDTIADLPPQARENAIVQEALKGNIPDFLRQFVPIRARSGSHEIVYAVAPDYLAIGSDEDLVRMPMAPGSAVQIADGFGCALPTRKMVNDIYAAATVKLEPQPLTEQREAVRTFVQHNDLIEKQRAGKPLGQLVAGDKKDVVVSNRLKEKPARVAIYGWHKPDGKPIQPLYVGHGSFYADYSHGIRLVKRDCVVDGKPTTIDAVLRDPALAELLSDEGVIDAGY